MVVQVDFFYVLLALGAAAVIWGAAFVYRYFVRYAQYLINKERFIIENLQLFRANLEEYHYTLERLFEQNLFSDSPVVVNIVNHTKFILNDVVDFTDSIKEYEIGDIRNPMTKEEMKEFLSRGEQEFEQEESEGSEDGELLHEEE